MELSYNWLNEYINNPYSPEEMVERLTMAGVEVEGIREIRIPDGVVVAEILSREKHPNADKLSVCLVSNGCEELQIVCGAPNCDAGAKVPLAQLGTSLTDARSGETMTLGKVKLRGVESCGMLCSQRELGLGEDQSGLMLLPPDAPVGRPLAEIIPADTVYELEITSNRPDWLSHWGIARDIRALSGNELSFPEFSLPEPLGEASKNLVTVEDAELCPRYTGRVIRGISVKESPAWLKRRLESIGLRPINNVVDITNFVLHELGHPLHAFDLSLLSGERVVVRRAKDGEKLLTLDEDEHELRNSQLVIADAEKPVALAGIMGGEHSGVTGTTTDILLESAYFDPANIRITSRDLGISSDSSYRFERGVDWDMLEKASGRATSLILELAGGELEGGLIDVAAEAPLRESLTCRFKKIRALLGTDVGNARIIEIFQLLGLTVKDQTEESCTVVPPSWRGDLSREADLAEEIIRIHGLEHVPLIPARAVSGGTLRDDAYAQAQVARQQLLALGLTEIVNYGQEDEKSALLDARFDLTALMQPENPVSLDYASMRPSLFGGLLRVVEYNISRSNHDLAFFELGNVFCADGQRFSEERREAAIALTGLRHPERFSAERDLEYDFYDLKGLLESWLAARHLSGEFRPLDESDSAFANFAEGFAAELLVNGSQLAVFGRAAERCTKGMRLTHPLFIALVDLDALLSIDTGLLREQALSHFPPVSRDVAFVANESLSHVEVLDAIENAGVDNLVKVELFDIFRDEHSLGAERKSMAYSLTFRHPDRTLTDEEVNSAQEKIRTTLAQKLKIELR